MLLSYVKRHYKIVIMLACFALIWAAILSLYQLETEAVLYASLLCAALGAILFALGYSRYLRRHRLLQHFLDTVGLEQLDLPRPMGALEADYQELLRRERRLAAIQEERAATRARDVNDYFTLWLHQIKTPITGLELLLQENSAASLELLHIRHYVEMVLTYLRLESPTSDYLFRECELTPILHQAAREYARLFILNKQRLQMEAEPIRLVTDEKWLLFVVEQLLSNALKYTPPGGEIIIKTQGPILSVIDTGLGVQEEDLPRLGEKGFTGYNGHEDRKSSGLGLYLCRRVCDQLGLGLDFRSQVGRGTEVRIDLAPAITSPK